MRTTFLISVILIFGAITNLSAQNTDSTFNRKFQCTFFYPVGTEGVQSHQYTNQVSLNILAGYNGGVNGFEAGLLLNTLKNDMKGCQMVGLGNTVLGDVEGAQFAGLFNVGLKNTNGLQMAGIANYSTRSKDIAQFAGIVNTIVDTLTGVQAAGIANFSTGIERGTQLSAIVNASSSDVRGIQGSAIINLSGGKTDGAQITAIVNASADSLTGAQISAITNICASRVNGTQISAIANVARSLNGFQLSLFNYADTLESGIPIGLMSIVRKNGYQAVEVSYNETMYANLSIKTGVRPFYNIFTAGMRTDYSDLIWGFGYGIGTIFPLGEKTDMNFDLTANSMHYNSGWTDELNILNKFSMSVNFKINRHISVFAGASLNMHISHVLDENGEPVEQIPVPNSSTEVTHNNTLMRIYPGLSFGLRL